MASSDLPGAGALRRAALTAVLLLAMVVAVGAVAVPAASLWARHAADSDRERLTGVATEVALLLSSLSVDSAEASLDRLSELSTGRLHDEVTRRRAEVLRTLDDDEVHSSAMVIASGVEQDVTRRGILDNGDGPARARLLVATRAEVRNAQTDATAAASGRGDAAGPATGRGFTGADDAAGERTWRWRLEAVIEGDRALVSSAEMAV